MQLTDDQRLVRNIFDRNKCNTAHKARRREGMQQLTDEVFNIYRDIKSVSNAMAPQKASEFVLKHNEKSPDHP